MIYTKEYMYIDQKKEQLKGRTVYFIYSQPVHDSVGGWWWVHVGEIQTYMSTLASIPSHDYSFIPATYIYVDSDVNKRVLMRNYHHSAKGITKQGYHITWI
jgi:hypothetical protein